MDYLRTDQDLPSGNATLLVFTPDAVKSQLVGAVEQWVRDNTACAPIARRWISHTEETIRRFYPGLPDASSEIWRVISTFFTAGPCLATLWFGEHASRLIPSIKGATHPACSPESSVRGRFWCDTALANLVHVSDDADEVERELVVLRSLDPDLFNGRLSTRGLAPFHDPGPPTPLHSSILTLCRIVTTLLSAEERPLPRLDVPDGGSARETMTVAEAWLGRARMGAPPAVAEAVEAYLSGTAQASSFLRALKDAAPVNPWEELILHCGIMSRPEWLKGR